MYLHILKMVIIIFMSFFFSSGNMVLRVPVLYGEVDFIEESAVTIILKQVKDTSKEQVCDDYAR